MLNTKVVDLFNLKWHSNKTKRFNFYTYTKKNICFHHILMNKIVFTFKVKISTVRSSSLCEGKHLQMVQDPATCKVYRCIGGKSNI